MIRALARCCVAARNHSLNRSSFAPPKTEPERHSAGRGVDLFKHINVCWTATVPQDATRVVRGTASLISSSRFRLSPGISG